MKKFILFLTLFCCISAFSQGRRHEQARPIGGQSYSQRYTGPAYHPGEPAPKPQPGHGPYFETKPRPATPPYRSTVVITTYSEPSEYAVLYIRQGSSKTGAILYNFDGTYIRSGVNRFGPVLYSFDGTYIRQGSSPYGTILFTLVGNQLRNGYSMYSPVEYSIDGTYIRQGMSCCGPILFNLSSY